MKVVINTNKGEQIKITLPNDAKIGTTFEITAESEFILEQSSKQIICNYKKESLRAIYVEGLLIDDNGGKQSYWAIK